MSFFSHTLITLLCIFSLKGNAYIVSTNGTNCLVIPHLARKRTTHSILQLRIVLTFAELCISLGHKRFVNVYKLFIAISVIYTLSLSNDNFQFSFVRAIWA